MVDTKRSAAAKKGWETRRRNQAQAGKAPPRPKPDYWERKYSKGRDSLPKKMRTQYEQAVTDLNQLAKNGQVFSFQAREQRRPAFIEHARQVREQRALVERLEQEIIRRHVAPWRVKVG